MFFGSRELVPNRNVENRAIIQIWAQIYISAGKVNVLETVSTKKTSEIFL